MQAEDGKQKIYLDWPKAVLPQIIHLHDSGEKNGEQRKTTLVSFDETMMQALELLRLAKGTSRDKATLNSEEIKPIALAVIRLHLS